MSNCDFKKKIFISKSPTATKNLGKNIAENIVKIDRQNSPTRKNGLVLLMAGGLGSGKTCFIQGFAHGLGIKERITSPTFVLMKKFKTPSQKLFYHFDCYRLQKPEEILALGWQEIVKNPQNIVAVEWPEKIKNVLPKNCQKFSFKFVNEKQRKITLRSSDPQRLIFI